YYPTSPKPGASSPCSMRHRERGSVSPRSTTTMTAAIIARRHDRMAPYLRAFAPVVRKKGHERASLNVKYAQGDEAVMKTYRGSCHCGRVQFEVDTDLDHVRVCDCSICRRRGALNHRVLPEYFRLLTSLGDLSLYTFHTHTARDYFC